jgi:hypothetical protein
VERPACCDRGDRWLTARNPDMKDRFIGDSAAPPRVGRLECLQTNIAAARPWSVNSHNLGSKLIRVVTFV